MRASDDLHDELTARGVSHEIVRLTSSSRTARLAADALGVDVGEIVKSLLFVLDEQRPVLALVPGDAMVDVQALARQMDARDARMASADEVRAYTGYLPGAVPPVGLEADVPVVADPGVFDNEVVYCGGGTTASMLKIGSADLAAVLGDCRRPIAARA